MTLRLGARTLGWWTIAALGFSLVAPWLAVAATDAPSTELAPVWQGDLDLGTQRLRIVVHLSRQPDGTLQATLDRSDNGVTGIPVESARFEKGVLHLRLPQFEAEYDGMMNERGDALFGFCRLNGAVIPLRLEPVTSAPLAKRPQLPDLPLPNQPKKITVAEPRGRGERATAAPCRSGGHRGTRPDLPLGASRGGRVDRDSLGCQESHARDRATARRGRLTQERGGARGDPPRRLWRS